MHDFITSYRNEHLDKLMAFYEESSDVKASLADRGVFASYFYTNDHQQTIFTVERMPFAEDIGEFMYTVEEAGIREFQLCDESTGLMEVLHHLLANGWEIVGTPELNLSYGLQRGLLMRKTGVAS